MNRYDVTKAPKSISGQVETLISEMQTMRYEDIKSRFLTIVNDEETQASKETRYKWNQAANRSKDKTSLMLTITNMYLAGARLTVGKKTKEQ